MALIIKLFHILCVRIVDLIKLFISVSLVMFSDILLLWYFIVIIHAVKFRGAFPAWQNACLLKTCTHIANTRKQRRYRVGEMTQISSKSGKSSQFKILMRARKQVYFIV